MNSIEREEGYCNPVAQFSTLPKHVLRFSAPCIHPAGPGIEPRSSTGMCVHKHLVKGTFPTCNARGEETGLLAKMRGYDERKIPNSIIRKRNVDHHFIYRVIRTRVKSCILETRDLPQMRLLCISYDVGKVIWKI